ncbi:hypothetical protein [Synechococcus sp. BIOS-U3-1]|uniref:hypothetical protein n=1 Tax=Synechococcus sp. BIOS-U3-1 TaxID=1400865 RepID=UPI0016495F9F|nr:hypothetical protein [Synechococcus sp. BIOS-U3-1]
MKSKLLIIAVMASVDIGLPLHAQTLQQHYRAAIISTIATAQCNVIKEFISEETAHELIVATVEEQPQLRPAYLWAVESDNARAAVVGLASTLGPYCNGKVANEVIQNVILPNLK